MFSFLFSCNHGGDKLKKLPVFTIEKFVDNGLWVDECFSQVKLLPLQLDTNQMIGQVKDVSVVGDIIFLLDEVSATLYSFDIYSGKCLASASKRGHGPNEYINPVALSVDVENLYVLDMPTSRIIRFDKELNAIGTIAFDFPASDFIALDGGFLLYNLAPTSEKGKFVYISSRGEYINSFVFPEKGDDFNNVLGGGKVFVKNKELEVFAFESYDDIVYKWNNDSLQPILRMDFGEMGIPAGMKNDNLNYFEEPYAFAGNIFMLSDMFIPSFFYKSKRYYGFIPLSQGESEFGLVKDNSYDIPFFPRWQYGDELIGICTQELAEKYFRKHGKSMGEFIDNEYAQEQFVLVFYIHWFYVYNKIY